MFSVSNGCRVEAVFFPNQNLTCHLCDRVEGERGLLAGLWEPTPFCAACEQVVDIRRMLFKTSIKPLFLIRLLGMPAFGAFNLRSRLLP